MSNFSAPGPLSYKTYTYASGLPRSGKSYGASTNFKDYAVFDRPDAGWDDATTRHDAGSRAGLAVLR